MKKISVKAACKKLAKDDKALTKLAKDFCRTDWYISSWKHPVKMMMCPSCKEKLPHHWVYACGEDGYLCHKCGYIQ